ncbi:hypothetical protein DSM112329_01149 [Paraconexibacter sp. AEG42_29]|uniref:ATP-dependent DNA helicase RecQ n=1 Tax=Paraconexibacter sp. AEG42_29 TaxID=2997339 RepID=A0AAU7AS41_9ACTN
MVTDEELRTLAAERLGHTSLRPGQLEAARAAAAGRDTLCVMSTGSGKSAVYQLAGLARGGLTVVVSPLIALQRDQLEGAIDAAAMLNSTLRTAERAELLESVAAGEVEVLLLAPEQLTDDGVQAALRDGGASLFVVDEAHCVSQWGHEFRPDYLRLAQAADAIGRPPILALTATAAPQVREEIAEILSLQDPEVVVRGFDRPNLHLEVRTFRDADAKRAAVVDFAVEAAGPGIVYCATQKATDAVAAALQERGVAAVAYHAGHSAARRDERQAAFMDPAGGVQVMVATIAFGMGVDKPDVRWVAHHDVSASVDAYYQEVGRAGRHGDPARVVLFFRAEDLGLRRYFAAGRVRGAEIDRVARALADKDEPTEPGVLADRLHLSDTKLATALQHFERLGFAEVLGDGRVRRPPGAPSVEEAVATGQSGEAHRKALDRTRVDMMRAYAESRSCRRALLLGYFGEPYDAPCGACDVCDADERDGTAVAAATAGFTTGDRVQHNAWGHGQVGHVDDDRLTVVFDTVGYKTLAAEVVEGDPDLLRPV